jgi:hypothetical protein
MSDLQQTLAPYVDPRWSFNMIVGCPKGWEQIVLDTHAKLIEVDPDYRISQIKEKFGGLRYYVQFSDRDLYEAGSSIIADAENLSYKTCEECGTTEDVDTDILAEGYYWILTLCGPCRATRLAARQAEVRRQRG